MEDIATICNRLIIVDRGKLIWDGETKELLEKFQKNKYITFIKSANFQVEKLDAVIVSQDKDKITIKVPSTQVDQKLGELTRFKQGTNYSIETLKLDDIIFELFSKGGH